MNTKVAGAVLVLGLLSCGTAQASGFVTWRAGVLGGTYQYEDVFTDDGCCGNPLGTEFTSDDSSSSYGGQVGMAVGVARFFADLGLELIQIPDVFGEDFQRTDVLLTLGSFIGDHWTLFAGYRYSLQGDGFFSSDSGQREVGPFLGGGFSAQLGKNWSLGTSLAANHITFQDETGQNIDDATGAGVSLKLQLNRLGSPHSVFLRGQRFQGDVSEPGSFEFEYTETYVQLGYQATFEITTW